MKILYVITGLTLSGAETQLSKLVFGIKDKHDIRIVNFFGGHYVKKLKNKGISVKTIKIGSKLGFLKAIVGLKKEIKEFEPNIVHSFLPHANVVCKTVKFFLKYKFKLICSIRVKEIKYIFHNIGERLFDFLCDIVITNSKTTKKFLVKKMHYDPEKINVIYNGVDFEKINGKDIFPSRKKIITVANFRKQKDYMTNVKTCEELLKHRDDFVVIYVGEGEELGKIKKVVKKKGLKDNVKFLGKREDAKELVKGSDVFFLPTLYEGQSNALIEAMYYKCPIVTTDIPENKEIIKDGKEGVLVKVKDYKKMAMVLDKVLEDKDLRERLKKKAYEKSKNFDVNKMVEGYEKVYSICVE